MHGLSVARLSRLVRSNVDRQLLPNGRSREAGTVAAIFGMLLAFGVLLGLGAIVIDTGSLLYERRQLQNGADAVALSIAQACAKGDTSGTPCVLPDPSLTGLAGANAADGQSDIASICGSAALSDSTKAGSNPSAFPKQCDTPPPAGLVECPATSSTAKYVEVRTSTQGADGIILKPFLAQMLAGGNYSGETVKACARAGWGGLSNSGPALPLVIGDCEWKNATEWNATEGGTLYATAPDPQYDPPPNVTEYRQGNQPYVLPHLPSTGVVPANTIVSIIAHTSGGSNTVNNCPADPAPPAGQDYPGGFGWTTADTTCSAIFTDTEHVTGNGGNAPPQDCKHAGPISSFVGTVVNIPIFKDVTIANGTATYTLDGIAAFYLAGYANISTVADMFGYTPPATLQCGPGISTTCIWGWFTQPDPTGGSIGGATVRGRIVVQVLG